jgi:XTP/dITP diphosphohydrolase
MTLTFSDLNQKLLVASHNDGKVREIRDLLAPLDIAVTSAKELELPEPVEDGETFEDNALIKTRACCKLSGLPSLSDDSGLCVKALDDKPGIHSARWAGEARDFGHAMQRIENQLQEKGATTPDQRSAFFVCVLALVLPDGREAVFRGECHGTMVWPPRGTLGFGYDPVFLPDGHERTFGEMTADEKHGWTPGQNEALSHRARAFARLWQSVFADATMPS